MIKSLYIKHYALLNNVNINLINNFTIITGETGSGKSMILDALLLLLGKRVDHSFSFGEESKCIIEGSFLLNTSHKFFFQDHDLDFEQETVIRREITQKGKSRAFINDTPVLLNILFIFGVQIVEFFAQNQAVLLKEERIKFQLIDQFSGSDIELQNYRKVLNEYNHLMNDLNLIEKKGNLSSTDIEFLEYQYDEIDNANIYIGEKEELEDRISLLSNIEGVSNAINRSSLLLDSEDGIINNLTSIKRQLLEFDSLSQLSTRIDSVIIELNDVNTTFSELYNTLDLDSREFSEITNRLDSINRLLQKHKFKFVNELTQLKDDIKTKIELSRSFDSLVAEKKSQIILKQKDLTGLVESLNKKRRDNITIFKEKVQVLLAKLAMPHARFDIEIVEDKDFHINGNSSISFLFSANKGNILQDISAVASGGELSRLMLIIKYITAERSDIDTLIFDEIDSGVSGEVASLMGDMMKEIGKSKQLIAVSHLPQIASKAKTHLKVKKSIINDKTVSSIIELNKEDRIDEIAKLLSGKKVTNAAIANAEELLNQ